MRLAMECSKIELLEIRFPKIARGLRRSWLVRSRSRSNYDSLHLTTLPNIDHTHNQSREYDCSSTTTDLCAGDSMGAQRFSVNPRCSSIRIESRVPMSSHPEFNQLRIHCASLNFEMGHTDRQLKSSWPCTSRVHIKNAAAFLDNRFM